MKNKKILLVSNMYPSKKYKYYGVFVENTIKILQENGYEVKKIVLNKYDNKLFKLVNYILFYIKIILIGIFQDFGCIYGHYASHIAIPLKIVKYIKPKTKIVINVHGNDIIPETKNDFRYIKYTKKILIVADKIVAPSQYFKKVLIDEYLCNEEKIDIYPSGGVSTAKFKKMDQIKARENLNLDLNCKYIGYVSRIEKNKGWDVFLRAINILNDKLDENVKFIVVGDGTEIENYNIMIKKLEINNRIIHYPLTSQSNLINIYNALDIFCFPTYRRSESLGLVGLEAMSCETIVIASDISGVSTYVVDGKNGFLFEPKNENILAQRILDILNLNNEEKNKIKKNARATALEYDANKTSEKILITIGNVINIEEIKDVRKNQKS